ncbi:hypothetical protein EK21DRAFT_73907 [Setomelanomma holmii]|uniref:Uncharacterized protein n=1 Tax=Setomelanomma holmii TaxID=210430 RepID=A0A9P4H384_9PLEO|nr:hypothetical protein EK21DRAFT_73907 [Setomelanomma holmii]
MASPVLNLTIFTKSVPHALRAIALASFPPGFLILLIQGIIAGRVNPAIGILPLFFSAAFSALLLANEKKCGCQASGLAGTPIHLVFDLIIGVGLLVCLILDWVLMTQQGLIHLYFVGVQLQDSLTPGQRYPMSCPQCQNTAFTVGNIKLANVSTGLRDGYAPLLDNEGRPRVSVDEPQSTEDGEMV